MGASSSKQRARVSSAAVVATTSLTTEAPGRNDAPQTTAAAPHEAQLEESKVVPFDAALDGVPGLPAPSSRLLQVSDVDDLEVGSAPSFEVREVSSLSELPALAPAHVPESPQQYEERSDAQAEALDDQQSESAGDTPRALVTDDSVLALLEQDHVMERGMTSDQLLALIANGIDHEVRQPAATSARQSTYRWQLSRRVCVHGAPTARRLATHRYTDTPLHRYTVTRRVDWPPTAGRGCRCVITSTRRRSGGRRARCRACRWGTPRRRPRPRPRPRRR